MHIDESSGDLDVEARATMRPCARSHALGAEWRGKTGLLLYVIERAIPLPKKRLEPGRRAVRH